MFGIKIQNPRWVWVTDEEGDIISFHTHAEAVAKAQELEFKNYIIDVIT